MDNIDELMVASELKGDSAGLIAAVSYIQGEPPKTLQVDEIGAALLNPAALVWIGLHHPEEELMTQVLSQLDVSLDSLGSLLGDLSMPRLSVLEREILIVLPTISWKAGHSRPHFGRLACLVGERFLVTVRRGPSSPHVDLRERLELNRGLLHAGCDHVAVEIVDHLIDQYVESFRRFELQVDRTERELMRGTFDRASIQRLYIMRRDFHRLHVAIEPIGEVCARVARLEAKHVSASARLRFDGLADRISRVDGLFDSLAEGLKFAFEAGMMIEQARQTDTTRKLASWAAIISIPTAIAGHYGMNFQHIPAIGFEYGYYFALALMGVACTSLYVLFKRAKWL
ncbi:CorA family divalent cation transporter [Orrella daihaiensis]|uniref:Magnesium and cobalt transport protein CorA n=1 Tax=Orrella daihaiensis TaxID=2782176 RepID=A0ABY4AKP2_9BURK|nr:CorA family divalent cation transporter [Orrella daihaiensis]UOD50856.1 magnesium and cobalt transport protein CorA [Orrella daihaiensis]